MELPACSYCGKPLTNPKSIKRGMGNICFMRHMGYDPEDDVYEFEDMYDDELEALYAMEPITIKGSYDTREVWINNHILSPVDSWKVKRHSPDGFAWGYSGSGPAQLALAIILVYITEESLVFGLYQRFKFEIIAGLPQTDFEVKFNMGAWLKRHILVIGR